MDPREPSAASEPGPEAVWWKRGVIYQVYPRSFQDSDGDGVGDLPGIIRRLDHLERLGVDAVWLSPIFPSPDADFGYDISDYTAVDPRYGSLADLEPISISIPSHRGRAKARMARRESEGDLYGVDRRGFATKQAGLAAGRMQEGY